MKAPHAHSNLFCCLFWPHSALLSAYLLALRSGITPDSAWGTVHGVGIKPALAACKSSTLTLVISYETPPPAYFLGKLDDKEMLPNIVLLTKLRGRSTSTVDRAFS